MKKEKIIDLLGDRSHLRRMREQSHQKSFPEMFALEGKLIEAVRREPFPDGVRMTANEFRVRVVDGDEQLYPSGYRFASGAEGNVLHDFYPEVADGYAELLAHEIAQNFGKKTATVLKFMQDEEIAPKVVACFNDWALPQIKFGLNTTNKYLYPQYHFDFFEAEEVEPDAEDSDRGSLKATAMEKRRKWKPLPEEVVHAIADRFMRTAARSALRGGPIMDTLGFGGKPFIYDSDK